MVLPAIPLIGWILSLALGAGAIWFSANVLNTVKITVVSLILFAAGIYALISFALPALTNKKTDSRLAIILTGISLAFIVFGVYGLFGLKYSIVFS